MAPGHISPETGVRDGIRDSKEGEGMLVATVIMLLGLVGGIVASQLRGLRLGGVLIVPLVAIYTLRSIVSLPIVLLSVLNSYFALRLFQRHVFLYGRQVFVVAILVAASVPVLVLEFARLRMGSADALSEIQFLGSVLPGIAAFNLYRLDEESRGLDVFWSSILLVFLLVVGIGLTGIVSQTPLRTATPPFLLGPESDVAVLLGVTESAPIVTPMVGLLPSLTVITSGFLLSESLRARYGVRLGGVIVLPLLVFFALRDASLLPLYVVSALVAFVGVEALHRWTLLYGRVLLSMGSVFGLATVTIVTVALAPAHGMLPFFVGLLGGVTGYNLHRSRPPQRRVAVTLTVAVFTLLLGGTRVFVAPTTDGLLGTVAWWHVVLGVVVVALGVRQVLELERTIPTGGDRGFGSTPELERQSWSGPSR